MQGFNLGPRAPVSVLSPEAILGAEPQTLHLQGQQAGVSGASRRGAKRSEDRRRLEEEVGWRKGGSPAPLLSLASGEPAPGLKGIGEEWEV